MALTRQVFTIGQDADSSDIAKLAVLMGSVVREADLGNAVVEVSLFKDEAQVEFGVGPGTSIFIRVEVHP